MDKVIVNILSPKDQADENGMYGHSLGTKTFNVSKDPTHKSVGYMVGYLEALGDKGYGFEIIE